MNDRIEVLVKRLIEANDAYRAGEPLISDAVFDALEDELRLLAPDHAYFKRVGAKPAPGTPWQKVKHDVPMGSLNKAQTIEEFLVWANAPELAGRGFVVSEKLDGLSVDCKYQDGRLVRALTRGDGETGEDITRNVLKMKGVRGEIPGFTGHLRGEILLKRSDHKAHFPEYANPRNAAAGIAKRLDGEGCEYLSVLFYRVISANRTWGETKWTDFCFLQRCDLETPNFDSINNPADIEAKYVAYQESVRDSLDYDIDGLVIEINSLSLAEDLGESNGRPNGAIALKFPHSTAKTTLRKVEWQIGNTGRLTPVAIFDPVTLDGAEIERASLYNVAYIEEIGLTEGAQILCSRRNQVIPRVEAVLDPNGGEPVSPPTACPKCGGSVAMEGEYLVCRNPDCNPAGAIKRWVEGLNILALGESIIDALVEKGWVLDPADLYILRPSQLADLELNGRKLGGSMADKIIQNLHDNSCQPLATIVGSLGIPMCGKTVCTTLVDAGFDSFEKMLCATTGDLCNVPGMGEAKADAFYRGIRRIMPVFDRLLANGVTIQEKATGHLDGTTWCWTGFRDKAMERGVEEAGGTVKSSAVKGLTYLVAANPNGVSTKLDKARRQGTKVVSPQEAWAIIRKETK
jgi:DNA ligase (NAD+)